MRRLLTLLSVCFVLSFAQAQPNPLADRTKTLRILVIGGHQVEMVRIGALVFDNKRSNIPTQDGKLAAMTFEEIKRELDREGRFDVRPVTSVQEQELARLEMKVLSSTGLWEKGFKAISSDVTEIAKSCHCDALLVVIPDADHHDPSNSQSFRGYAWVAHGDDQDLHAPTHAAASLNLLLLDGLTGKVVESAQTRRGGVSIPETGWPMDMQTLDADQWGAFRIAVRASLRASLREPLYRLGLRPSCADFFHGIWARHGRMQRTQDPFAPNEPVLPAGADPAKCR